MSASSTIGNLQQALNCAGKCDCCDNLQNQINSLNQKINNLENKIVSKTEFNQYKQYVENNFEGIRKNFQYIYNQLENLINNRYQELSGFLDGTNRRIDDLQRRLGGWDSGDSSEALRVARDAKRTAEAADIEALKARKRADESWSKANSVEQAFNGLRNEFNLFKLDINNRLAGFVSKVEFEARMAYHLGLIKSIQAFLATGLPALIKSIIWSILLSAAFNTLINGLIGTFNAGAIEAAKREARDAWNLALRALGLAREAKDDAAGAATIAVKAEGKADQALEEIEFVKQTALAAMKRLEAFIKQEIEFLTKSTRDALLRLQTRIGNLENYVSGLVGVVQNLTNQIASLFSQIGNLTNRILGLEQIVEGLKLNFQQLQSLVTTKIGELTATIQAIKTDLLNQLGKVKLDIAKIFGQLATLAAQIAGILLTIAGIQALLRGIRPVGNVINNNFVTNNYIDRRTNLTTNNYIDRRTNLTTNNYIDRRTNLTNAGQGPAIDLALLKKIDRTTTTNLGISQIMNIKLGAQLKDGLAGWMTRFTNWDVVNRAVNLMTLAATIHNASMLSQNLFVTLISAMQNVVNFIELKDSEGKGYDIQSLINNSIENFLKNALGEATYQNLNAAWKTANRIYQSSANLFNSLLNMGDTMTQAMQVIGGGVGKIGNALRAWDVVSEKAYGWMNPQPNFNNPVLTKLQNLNDTASIVETVSVQPLTVKDAKTELEQASAQLAKDLGQVEGSKDGIIVPEAEKEKAKQATAEAVSKGKDLTENDLEAD